MTDTAAQRVQAYLDWEDSDGYVAAIHDGDGNRRSLEITDLRTVLDEHRQMRETIRVAHQALSRQPASCRWHGTKFDEVDTWLGVPRCESCRSPYRVMKALESIAALDRRLVGEWQPADDNDEQRFLDADVRRVVYPEIDYPQELRDQHQPWPLPQINALIDHEEAEHGLARSQWAPEHCTCPWPWPLGDQHIRTNCPARPKQD